MKTITTVLTIGFAIITASIIYLIKSGISIRTAPIIKPSIISDDFKNVPNGLFTRLFPDIQQAHYILWGIPKNSTEVQKTLDTLKQRCEKEFKASVNIIDDGLTASAIELEKCQKPCWVYLPEEKAHALAPNLFIEEKIKPSKKTYFSISWVPFSREVTVPDSCIREKRLDYECLKVISINEVLRKMPEPKARYFFVRKYLDNDFFLFIENPKIEKL